MPDAGEAIHVRQFKSELLIMVRLRSKSSRFLSERRSCEAETELNFQLASVGEKTRSTETNLCCQFVTINWQKLFWLKMV